MLHKRPTECIPRPIVLLPTVRLHFKLFFFLVECGRFNEAINLSAQLYFISWSSWIMPWLGCYLRESPPTNLSFASVLSCHQNLCMKSLCFWVKSIVILSFSTATLEAWVQPWAYLHFFQLRTKGFRWKQHVIFHTFYNVENEASRPSYGGMKLTQISFLTRWSNNWMTVPLINTLEFALS